MFCPKCGAQVEDGTQFCPNCGEGIGLAQQMKQDAGNVFNKAEQEMGNAFQNVGQEINNFRQNGNQQNGYQQNGYQQNGYQNGPQQNGYQQNGYQNGPQQNGNQQNGYQNGPQQNGYPQNGAPQWGGQRLQTDRSLVMYILLSIVTCGIYAYYFIWKLASDVNVACEGDGKKTPGLVTYILLSIVTCGIYSYYWMYSIGNRLQENAPRYGMSFSENGTTILMWQIFGMLLCCLGPFFAMNILITNTNRICLAYNQKFGL